ncbi:zinc ribbon domain-containing protein [uncultured Pseudoteredinibacter sp.]|uniref:Zn-ribbon domain-containing OB-fold protein n=1 Tax=uncultured Pseudoteredinibacter sp. TaxID=1641701 RepID=UPI002632CA9C|nr:zinc ribbon domain-containing protein [uncultured Pseudoteredinibacter sp.]
MADSKQMPPAKRTNLGAQLKPFAEQGELRLQQCLSCQQFVYPPREVCGHCLSGELSWEACPAEGQVLARVDLHNSFEPFYAEQLPWVLLSVKLDAGPVVYAHSSSHAGLEDSGLEVEALEIESKANSGDRVTLSLQLDEAEAPVFVAQPLK